MIHASVPVDLGREEARERAEEELSRPGYNTEPAWYARAIEWVLEQLDRLISGAASALPGGLGTVLLLAVVAAVLTIVVLRAGPMARRRRGPEGAVFTEPRRTAAEHRAAADDAARTEDWTTAVIERFRAVVMTLSERGIVESTSGQTAAELAGRAGERLPDTAAPLFAAARLFDRSRYGGRTATSDDDSTLRELDRTVQRARPRPTPPHGSELAVPR